MGPKEYAEIVGGVFLAYTAWKSRKAERQTKAVGNGFAHFVKESLGELKDTARRTEQKIDQHLQDHAGNDVRKK